MKRRSKEVKPEIDLGVINMTPVECTPVPNALKFTEEPIKIKGKMVFNPEPLKGNAEIQIIDAEIIK